MCARTGRRAAAIHAAASCVNSEPQTDAVASTRANRTSNAVFLEVKRPPAEIWILCRILRLNWI